TKLQRWCNPNKFGWYSGDTHIHPERQMFGDVSNLGLHPETLYRETCGEALNVGSILLWEGGYYYERQFLNGRPHEPANRLPFPEIQQANHTSLVPHAVAHNDDTTVQVGVEHTNFRSSQWGHLVLLDLKNHDYPGVKGVRNWPSWNLPI